MDNNTIAAISTPFAQGGIGVIRISGPEAKGIASKVFKSACAKSILHMQGYRAMFGHVFDEDGEIDEAILLNFNAPHSYTGEDVIEISVHSGLYILKRVLRAVINAGAKLAEGGEFTKRAFLNGKISLTQAESVMDLISAQSGQAAHAALMAKEGAIFEQIYKIKGELLDLIAHISAWIDYPEEDIIDISKEEIKNVILNVKDCLKKLESTFDVGKILKEGINTVIIGKPNVGKSTLMNLLVGTTKSIVTDIPGTTRDVIEENILLDDVMLNIFDTAGIRDTLDLVEKQGVYLAQQKIEVADIILAVFDNSREFDEEDESVINQLDANKTIAIINKIDLVCKLDVNKIVNKIPNVIMVEGNNIKSKEIISAAVKQVLNLKNIDPSAVIISNERQLFCIKNAIKNIGDVLNSIENNYTYDAIAVSIEAVIDSLLELTGEQVSESVVNKVFAKFCVGK